MWAAPGRIVSSHEVQKQSRHQPIARRVHANASVTVHTRTVGPTSQAQRNLEKQPLRSSPPPPTTPVRPWIARSDATRGRVMASEDCRGKTTWVRATAKRNLTPKPSPGDAAVYATALALLHDALRSPGGDGSGACVLRDAVPPTALVGGGELAG